MNLEEIAAQLKMPYVFKASFDKASANGPTSAECSSITRRMLVRATITPDWSVIP